MHFPPFGRRRISIVVRLDEVFPDAQSAIAAYDHRRAQREARAIRERLEYELASQIGWIR